MRRSFAAFAALALVAGCKQAPAQAETKPTLMFLSSLPVLFAEDFALDAPASPLRDALEERFTLRPIDIADRQSLLGGDLLLMAQPRAQTAEALVDLDTWVRDGGRLLLLADPNLTWPTSKALGDRSAPMIAFADTGLLGHWGLTLFRPDGGERAGSFTVAPGSGCVLENRDAIARCAIGKGRVTVVADADFVREPEGAKAVVAELASLVSTGKTDETQQTYPQGDETEQGKNK